MKNKNQMGVIATNKNQNILIYSSENSIGKQAIAYLEDSKNKVFTIDVTKTKVSGTQWLEIFQNLKLHPKDFVNKEHPDFSKKYNKDAKLSKQDWIKIVQNNPTVMTNPVLIVKDNFYKIETPSDIRKYIDNSSEEIDEKKHI